MFFLVRIDSVQQSNKIDCSLLAMTAFKKNTLRHLSDSTFSCLEFSYICLFLDKNNCGFRFLHLAPGIRDPDTGPRTPGPGFQLPESTCPFWVEIKVCKTIQICFVSGLSLDQTL